MLGLLTGGSEVIPISELLGMLFDVEGGRFELDDVGTVLLVMFA